MTRVFTDMEIWEEVRRRVLTVESCVGLVPRVTLHLDVDRRTLTLIVNKPRTFSIDDLHAISAPQDCDYRMRCVEAWSMVTPWE